jgi:hypothetical protein
MYFFFKEMSFLNRFYSHKKLDALFIINIFTIIKLSIHIQIN